MRVRQHIPSFVSGVERQTHNVHTGEELEQLEFVDRWMHMPKFYRFSVSEYLEEGIYLFLAEFEQGARWWVVAQLSGDDAPIIIRDYPVCRFGEKEEA